MGAYDTFLGTDGTAVQLKIGPCEFVAFMRGDKLPNHVEDGVYYGYEGIVVVCSDEVLWVSEELPDGVPADLPRFTKWGDKFDPAHQKLDDFNPTFKAIQ